ncbi:alpha/beta fold hydrolase [Kribbella sp. NPDC051952]|uniref:alpha/beta fold hydrolase n=1 Tax=Kribbella sp. NPDC051952 TaxID=3154851 RepID=UPI00343EB4DA
MRSLPGDAASARTFLQSLSVPIVVVGHSYGGAVVTNAATGTVFTSFATGLDNVDKAMAYPVVVSDRDRRQDHSARPSSERWPSAVVRR